MINSQSVRLYKERAKKNKTKSVKNLKKDFEHWFKLKLRNKNNGKHIEQSERIYVNDNFQYITQYT